jgi:CubicO group peptidase (beta-lactamase class C family)
MKILRVIFLVLILAHPGRTAGAAEPPAIPTPREIDAKVAAIMKSTGARGLAVAVVDRGRVVSVQAFGARNAAGDPLQTDTVMYGASLTKTVMAYTALKLVDQGLLALDRPIATYLPKPLPDFPTDPRYDNWTALKNDDRWRKITARHILTHSTGFANFGFMEPGGALKIHFEPGARYAYSGAGIVLLQLAIEQGLGRDVGQLTQACFDDLGMTRTSLVWRADFAANLADGWDDRGRPGPHDERSRVRAAGSMDTTIADIAKFAAALVRGEGLSTASRAAMARPQLPITTAHQFPSFAPELPVAGRRKDLAAGLGVVVFDGPQGRGFFKGGHNEITANTLVCLEANQRAIVILANDVRAEAAFAELVRFILGETGVPYDWEYGDQAGKS